MRTLTRPWSHGSTLIGLLTIAAAAIGCGDGGGTTGSGGSAGSTTSTTGGGGTGGSETTSSSSSGGTGGSNPTTSSTGGSGGSNPTTSSTGGSTGTGTVAYECNTTAPGETRGSAIALSPDDKVLAVVNRDVGTVSIFHVEYPNNVPAMAKVAELVVGAPDSEPWQVAMDACGSRAYVVLRKDQKLVELIDLETDNPSVGATVDVGSEPTGVAITPNNSQVFVTNWVDGTVTSVATADMTVSATIDLNPAIAATGTLGTVEPRAALAHPRAVAITNNGDGSDADETVYVTEWFAVRTAADALSGVTIDTNWKGLLYEFAVGSSTVTTLDLPPVMDTGFNDHNDAVTGCFPNQVGSVTLHDGFAWVTSTCASPKGPIGVFAGKNPNGACTVATQAADCGAKGGVCNANTLTCNPNTTDVKTTTHPAVTIVNLATGMATTQNLDRNVTEGGNANLPKRMPLLPSDIGFKNSFAYLSSVGADMALRMTTANGAISAVGSMTNNFVNLRKDAADKLVRNPIGIAIANAAGLFAFVANDGSRDVTALDLNSQAIGKDGANNFLIAQSSALPAAGSQAEKVLRGKRFFNTGLGRWSLAGEGWGSCAACHIDGLTDNVTWYFARGPRQSVSLDGSFATKDGSDQRIFNWTAIFDEVADFEGNTRGISGGVGAIVSTLSDPPIVGDRINTASPTPPQQGLQGSSADTASPMGVGAGPHGVLNDWEEITAWVKTVRSPRRPTNLVAADVAAGKVLFDSNQGNCVGCHSGAKWTVSKVFWPVGNTANDATASASPESLGNKDWFTGQNLNGFPAALFPVTTPDATNARMRFGAPPGAEQMQCVLKPVGTIKTGADTTSVSPAEVGVLELRQDMVTKGQGAADTGRGFNPPSLLGQQIGAPYFHAGNARTLEEAFDVMFQGHYQSAVAQIFQPNATQKKQLVAYLLSIDEDETAFNVPLKGAKGGDLCFYP